jgi:hypothetical protein
VGVIGDTLSAARARRAVDLEQVEAATGIRTRYLRAIEAEDWEALPEEFYVRAFIRKYAQFVGADPEPLVEEYRRQRGEAPGVPESPTSPFARTGSRRAEALRRRRKRQSFYSWAAVVLLVAAVVVAALVLIGGGSSETKDAVSPKAEAKKKHVVKGQPVPGTAPRPAEPKAVKLAIEPTAEVWACVLDAKGKPLVDGLTLAAGEAVGPFHSRSFTAAFGNGSVALSIDGKHASTPTTSSPIGLRVDRHGKVHQLPEGQRPSCE